MHIPDQLADQWNEYQSVIQTPFDQLNIGDYIKVYRIIGKRIFQGYTLIQDKVTKTTDSYIFAYSGKYYKSYERNFKIIKETKEE